MTIPVRVLGGDGKGNVKELGITDEGEARTAMEPYRRYRPAQILFLNPDYGFEMNQNGLFGGLPELIHDGTDTSAWTGSNIIGVKPKFDNGERPRPPSTLSIKVDNPAVGDTWQFLRASSIDLSSYVAITLWINIDKDWDAGDGVSIQGWDTGTGLAVGTSVNLEDYANSNEFDVWHNITIPLTAMSLEAATIDAFRMVHNTKGTGKSPKFYIDDFQLEETGEIIEFLAVPPQGQKFTTYRVRVTIAGPAASTLSAGTMPALSYDQILGLTLTNGMGLQWVEDSIVRFSLTFKQLGEFFDVGFNISNAISDGTNTAITMDFDYSEPLVIDGPASQNYMSILIRDDMTSLLKYNVRLIGKYEVERD